MGQLRRIAFVFAGQGAQKPGMGRSLYESSEAARQIFHQVEALRPGTMKQCFEGTLEELTQTKNTQPCMWTVEMACAAALGEQGVSASASAGFSLGEFAALAYTRTARFEDVFALLCKRALLMDDAAQLIDAGMLAVLKLGDEEVESLCEEFAQVWPVNYNCPGQVVVAGVREELALFSTKVKEAGGKALPLKVSSAFHSPLMARAASAFEEVAAAVAFSEPAIPLYSNVTALPHRVQTLPTLLALQMARPVLWSDTIAHLIQNHTITTFVELGPGTTLSGLIARCAPQAEVLNVEDQPSLKRTLEVLAS